MDDSLRRNARNICGHWVWNCVVRFRSRRRTTVRGVWRSARNKVYARNASKGVKSFVKKDKDLGKCCLAAHNFHCRADFGLNGSKRWNHIQLKQVWSSV